MELRNPQNPPKEVAKHPGFLSRLLLGALLTLIALGFSGTQRHDWHFPDGFRVKATQWLIGAPFPWGAYVLVESDKLPMELPPELNQQTPAFSLIQPGLKITWDWENREGPPRISYEGELLTPGITLRWDGLIASFALIWLASWILQLGCAGLWRRFLVPGTRHAFLWVLFAGAAGALLGIAERSTASAALIELIAAAAVVVAVSVVHGSYAVTLLSCVLLVAGQPWGHNVADTLSSQTLHIGEDIGDWLALAGIFSVLGLILTLTRRALSHGRRR